VRERFKPDEIGLKLWNGHESGNDWQSKTEVHIRYCLY
jgi:hypothetical protein